MLVALARARMLVASLACASLLAVCAAPVAAAPGPPTTRAGAIAAVALHPWRLGPDTTPLPFWPLRDPTQRERIFSAIQAMGIRNARVDLRWYQVESRIKGIRDWSEFDAIHSSAQAHGVTLLPMVAMPPSWANGGGGAWTFPRNPKDFEDFMVAALGRYPDIPAWEVWNEPNLLGFSQPTVDPAKFVEMLAAAHRAKLRAESHAKIVSGGLLSTGPDARQFFEQMVRLHAFDYVDGFAIHPYGPPPPDEPGSAMLNVPYFHDRLVQIGKPNMGIWLTEYGASTSAVHSEYGPPMDGQEQAERLRAAFAMAARWPWVENLTWYEFQDLCTDPADVMCNFGIVREDMSRKPSAAALEDIVQGELPKLTSRITLARVRSSSRRARLSGTPTLSFRGLVDVIGADRVTRPVTVRLSWAPDADRRPVRRRVLRLSAEGGRFVATLRDPKPGFWLAVATYAGSDESERAESEPVTAVVKPTHLRRHGAHHR
jgi:hypothetical protein